MMKYLNFFATKNVKFRQIVVTFSENMYELYRACVRNLKLLVQIANEKFLNWALSDQHFIPSEVWATPKYLDHQYLCAVVTQMTIALYCFLWSEKNAWGRA